ncbi:MAG TPA: PhzF family phenazine biosynthesis protein [Candidatus Thermoplasmatota archaeon]|nr:PhzF family phenazine biosynthesis protein [Candidatus Thermoplasmatota archaeon]
MRRLEAYKVDAFTTTPFSGNAAGVVPDAKGLTEREMQLIAREMSLSETAFLLPPTAPGADAKLRYFTPTTEIKLCGHATVATFHLLSSLGRLLSPTLKLETNVGVLDVEVRDGMVWLSSDPVVVEPSPLAPDAVARLLGAPRVRDPMLVKGMLLCTVDGMKAMEALAPDLPAIARLYRERGIDGIVPVSFETHDPANLTHIRYFVPGVGIDEDPVTGAAHMSLAGYLLRLGRITSPARFTGEQGHFRGRPGVVTVDVQGDPADPRVRIGGTAVVSLEGSLRLP